MKKAIIPAIITILAISTLVSCKITKIDAPTDTGEVSQTTAYSEGTQNASSDTEAPNTQAERTDPPMTEAHVTEAPITEAPITEPPITEAPPITEPEIPSVSLPLSAGNYEPKVFMYHLILDEPYSIYEALFVRPKEFESHLDVLNSMGFTYIFAEEYGKYDRPTVILTFDDGYEDNYTNMFPLLKEKGAKATVFLVKNLVGTDGYLTEAQIKEMSESGLVSFQTHTVSHLALGEMTEERVEYELSESISYIEGLTGRKVGALAYPGGSFSDTALSVAKRYVNFAYCSRSPNSYKADNMLLIPRYYARRGCSPESFGAMAQVN